MSYDYCSQPSISPQSYIPFSYKIYRNVAQLTEAHRFMFGFKWLPWAVAIDTYINLLE